MDISRGVALVDRTIFKNSSLSLAPDSGYERSEVAHSSSNVSSGPEASLLSTISGAVPLIG